MPFISAALMQGVPQNLWLGEFSDGLSSRQEESGADVGINSRWETLTAAADWCLSQRQDRGGLWITELKVFWVYTWLQVGSGRIEKKGQKVSVGIEEAGGGRRRMCKQQRHLHFIGAATNGRIFVKLQPSALVLLFNFAACRNHSDIKWGQSSQTISKGEKKNVWIAW